MTKVTRPLFGERASGNIADIGTFRMGRHGPEFIRIAKTDKPATARQRQFRDCFKAARAAWIALPIKIKYVDNKPVEYRDPEWIPFWNNWLAEHPDCN